MPQETAIDNPENSTPSGEIPDMPTSLWGEREIDLIGIATLLLREKKTILKFVLCFIALTAVTVFLMKPTYTAEAVFLPPQSLPGSGASQMASQLSSLGAMGVLGGLKSPGDLYIGILSSRTIAETLNKRFDLQKVYGTRSTTDTLKKLKKYSKFIPGKDMLVAINVEDHDPKRAADLANGYLDALRELNGHLALTDAAQKRLFLEQQLEREKDALADAEVEMKKTQEETGLIVPSGQAQVEIESMAQIRAQITSRQVELASLRQGATDQNPEVILLQTQIAGLQQELQKLQNDPSQRQPGSVQLPTAKVPALALQYIRKQREVKYHEALFQLIAKQYEIARLDEARDAPLLQVIDPAIAPEKKSGPSRMLLLFGSCLLGALIGSAWILGRFYIADLQKNPLRAQKIQDLRQAASLRK